MSGKSLKVTDRRIFTPDGELREEYQHLDEAREPAAEAAAEPAEPAAPAARPAAPKEPEPPPRRTVPEERLPAGYQVGPAHASPGFFDLVGLLAEPASLYLREAHALDPQSEQNLEMARLHIDLLAVLRAKTNGNLDPREQAMLDDVLYQLRSAFVEKRKGYSSDSPSSR